MKFINNKEEKIKVEVENTNPKVFRTLSKGCTIEASMAFAKYYEDSGLTVTKEELKAVEGKAGKVIVETKVLEPKKEVVPEKVVVPIIPKKKK